MELTVLQKKSDVLTLDNEAQYRGLPRCLVAQTFNKVECIHPLPDTLSVATDTRTSSPGFVDQTTATSAPEPPRFTNDAASTPARRSMVL